MYLTIVDLFCRYKSDNSLQGCLQSLVKKILFNIITPYDKPLCRYQSSGLHGIAGPRNQSQHTVSGSNARLKTGYDIILARL